MLKTRVAVLTDKEYTEVLQALGEGYALGVSLGRDESVLHSAINKLNHISEQATNGVSIYPNHSNLSDAA